MATAGAELVILGCVICDEVHGAGDSGTELVGGDSVGRGPGEVDGEAVLGRSC